MNASLKFLAAGLMGLMVASTGQAGRMGHSTHGGNRHTFSVNRSFAGNSKTFKATKKVWFGRYSCRRWYPRMGCYIYWNPSCSCWYYYSPSVIQYVPVSGDDSINPPSEDDE